MNLPNTLTLSRIVLAAVLVLLLHERSLTGNIWAVIVFVIASLTDFFDGHLAKTRGVISDFGKIMDPIADKVLMLSVFAVLAHLGQIAAWMFIVIAVREVGVTLYRLQAMRQGLVLPAEKAGKMKTVAQMIAVSSLLLYLVARQFEGVLNWWAQINYILMLAAVVLTVYSGIECLRRKKI
ncbi:MAG: CDP-diacylglycerol--glycerol-3-phosphate 3-phosphatidyltransferase [Candidatus Omnitrophica bacterium]|nr:CDP-diacylglycerol--glycerol-3-phosphate 3-phosphatidyltransferase [Candidatus Omnitrophota bacterium]